jgi:hypothetical protein
VESVAVVTTVQDSDATEAATCELASSSSSIIQLQSVRTEILSSSFLTGGGMTNDSATTRDSL